MVSGNPSMVGHCDSYDVSDAIGSNIVILNDTESGIRGLALHQLRSSVDVVGTLVERRAVDGGIGDRGIDVLAQSRETEGIEVDGTALQSSSGACFRSRVATDVGGRRKDAG
jgi:hypothetical protein